LGPGQESRIKSSLRTQGKHPIRKEKKKETKEKKNKIRKKTEKDRKK
jgi:hypothetical protein